MEMKRFVSVYGCSAVIFSFICVLGLVAPSISIAKLFWPMFLAATANSKDGGSYSNIRVPSDYTTIQAAIDAAKDGDVILVADGVYTGSGNRDIRFNKPVTLRSENGASKTIIDCQGQGRGFLFKNDEGKAWHLDGFTIKNGSASWINGAGSEGGGYGGGIVVENASPVIENCIITNCSVASDVSAFGGGIVISDSKARLTNCTISNNTIALPPGESPVGNLQGGGGIVIQNNSTPTLYNCTITGNKTTGESTGGGIYVRTASNPTISNCTISYNESNLTYPADVSKWGTFGYIVTNSGGLSFRDSSGGLVENTTISYNKAQERAGLGCFESSPTVRNSIIEYNMSTVEGGGGVGLYENSNAQFYDTIIRNNRAEDVDSINPNEDTYGAGVTILSFTPSSTGPSFFNCTIENNEAVGKPNSADGSTGGGITISQTSPTFSGCIIRNNKSDDRPGISMAGASTPFITNSLIEGNTSTVFGGGLWCTGNANAVITNCTVVNNSGALGIGFLAGDTTVPKVTNSIFWGNDTPVSSTDWGTPVITYSNIGGGYSGTGNLSSNPNFVNASNDFHLIVGSPCIDSGNNSAQAIGTTDLDGLPRLNGVVDMGAYEYQ